MVKYYFPETFRDFLPNVGEDLRQFFSKSPWRDALEKNCRKPKPTAKISRFGKVILNHIQNHDLNIALPMRTMVAPSSMAIL
jgi:hypothetical protein